VPVGRRRPQPADRLLDALASYTAACPATEDGHDLDLEFEGDLRVADAQPE
jgi:hypothetical protein